MTMIRLRSLSKEHENSLEGLHCQATRPFFAHTAVLFLVLCTRAHTHTHTHTHTNTLYHRGWRKSTRVLFYIQSTTKDGQSFIKRTQAKAITHTLQTCLRYINEKKKGERKWGKNSHTHTHTHTQIHAYPGAA